MKRTLIASVLGIGLLGLSAPSADAQGVIAFGNYTAINGHDQPVRQGDGTPMDDPGAVISLWAGQGVINNSYLLTQIATTPLISIPGYGAGWYDMAISQTGEGFARLPGSIWSGTQTVTFQVRGNGTSPYVWAASSALWQETPASMGGSIWSGGEGFAAPMINGPMPLVVYLDPPPPPGPEPSMAALTLAGSLLYFARRNKH